MRPFLILLTLVMLASAAVSGCFGGDDTPTTGNDEELAEQAVATEESGSITGQVVTNDLEVIANAAIGLSQGGTIVVETTTDKQGKFTFNGVEPGKYRVQVSSVCCKVGLKDVDVLAGEVTSMSFQLDRLTQDDLRVPYVSEQVWEGFISCGVATPAVSAAACSLLEDTPVEDPNEEFLIEFEVNKGIQEFVTVMDWDPVGGVSGGEFRLLVEDAACVFNDCPYAYADLEGPPPLRADIDEAAITEADWKWATIEDNRTMQFRVFAGGDMTLIYQQPFTVYYSSFYYHEAPDGYDPVPDA